MHTRTIICTAALISQFFLTYANSELNSILVQPDELIVTSGTRHNAIIISRYTAIGILDPLFGSNGSQTTIVGSASRSNSIAIQADNKLLVGGSANTNQEVLLSIRYESNGNLDNTFGTTGIVTTTLNEGSQINAITIQTDQKIVTCGSTITNGSSHAFIARYNTDGTIDTTFGTNGIVVLGLGSKNYASGIIIDASTQNIIIAGTKDINSFFIARYSSNGILDPTFGNSGVVETPLGANSDEFGLVHQSIDDKYIICGTTSRQSVLVRYNTDGTLDTTFGLSGIVLTSIGQRDVARSIAIQGDGNIITAGSSDTSILLARYLTNGIIDVTFGSNGTAIIELDNPTLASDCTLDTLESILAVGSLNQGPRRQSPYFLKLIQQGQYIYLLVKMGLCLFLLHNQDLSLAIILHLPILLRHHSC